MKYVVIICALLGAGLLYLLSSASANTAFFSHNYSSLFVLTVCLALSLSALVIYQIWQLVRKLRSRVFGAKLTLRLAAFFCVIAILPGVLVYAVSVQFLGKSIESWFDIRVENALEGGLNLGRNSLESELKQLGKKAQFLALLVAEQSPEKYRSTLLRLIDKSEGQEIVLFDANGRAIVVVNGGNLQMWKSLDAETLALAKKTGSYKLIDALPNNQLILRVLISAGTVNINGKNETLMLHVAQPVSKEIAADAETVQTVYNDYQQLSSSRLGLKRLYGITLTLSLLIVLLSAVSAAFFLSARLSAPLAALAEGTRAVAKGDYSSTYPVQSKDELGALTGLFNQMIIQLSDAKNLSQQQQQQVEKSKGFLESILTNLSSGVVVLDVNYRLMSMNASAEKILGLVLHENINKTVKQMAAEQATFKSIEAVVMEGFSGADYQSVWQKQLERLGKNLKQILLFNGMKVLSISDNI